MNDSIGKVIAKAIRSGKWVYITYLNKNGETTYFWIAINDIEFKSDDILLQVSMYNPDRNIEKAISSNLHISQIRTAKILDFTEYEVPATVLKKLDDNMGRYEWLKYEQEISYLLDYYDDCNWFDKDPYQKQHIPISGIDYNVLLKNSEFVLNTEQKKILTTIYKGYAWNEKTTACNEFAISRLAITKTSNNRIYIVCYNNVYFNPDKSVLSLDKTLRFNKTFLFKKLTEMSKDEAEGKATLLQYTDMDVDQFIEQYKKDEKWGLEVIEGNLRKGEIINTMPEMMIIEREIAINVRNTFDAILDRYENGKLNVPLKSFFGMITGRDNMRRKEPNIIICDEKINVDQTRVLYNAMKQPVTYVQGPPGTGKTQTILNVVLNGFYNDKTVLVCSSNNTPVDGILEDIEKLNIKYHNKPIPYPFIRLGDMKERVPKALDKIKEFFSYISTLEPDEAKISRIKNTTNSKNEQLCEILKRQEKHVKLESFYKDAVQLQKNANAFGMNNQFSKNIAKRVEELAMELATNPEVKNEEVLSLFTPLKNDYQLIQWMYFTSLKYIRLLQKPAYDDLRGICEITDKQDRVRSFNEWLSKDENMKRFTKVFPVIFTTNISASRLGTPNYMFDLVVMDEAGQCNVAHSLIPITKANSLLLVGDPEQLRPIVVIEDSINQMLMKRHSITIESGYDYKRNSILDVMRNHDSISQYVLLKYHYRCSKKIINFSNRKYYDSKLDLSTIKDNGELVLLNVKNINNEGKNSACEETEAIIDYLKRNGYTNTKIITPFTNQRELINKRLQSENIDGIKCETIHSMQGGESETIIISTALSTSTRDRTFEWIKNNTELINVAVTRAKKKLIVACDEEVLTTLAKGEQSDIVDLVQYVKSQGTTNVPLNEMLKVELGKSNNSYYEKEFYKTISQFCSVHQTFEAKRNVAFSTIFADDAELSKLNYEFDCVLYEKRWNARNPVPKIVIEINGGEHFGNKAREAADRRKAAICKEKEIDFLMIPNTFVKSYEQLREIILNSKNAADTQLSLLDALEKNGTF